MRRTLSTTARSAALLLLIGSLALIQAPAGATPAAPAAPAVTKVAVGGGTGIVVGHGQQVTPTYGYLCTMTTVGRDRTGALVGLTNAHCFYDNNGNQWIGDEVYLDTSTPGTSLAPSSSASPDVANGPIGTVEFISGGNPIFPGPNGPGLDYAVIRLDESKVQPVATVNGVTIRNVGPPPRFGTIMCKVGRSSGVTCGMMLGHTGGGHFAHTIWEVGGDSGSPVVVGETLVGNQWIAGGSASMVAILARLDARGGLGAGFQPVAP